ncbi:MAG TPA: hypothetical protein VN669_13150 [Candidatus Acidoferrales bacterium]|jgi:hypothetical protein|nr:hypothetical protein [Candidatus Acidoferrales bacterium]
MSGKFTGGLTMQVPRDTAIEAAICQFNNREHAVRDDEAMWFLLWMGVWVVALAVLLPSLI